jgi:hypothetical protein
MTKLTLLIFMVLISACKKTTVDPGIIIKSIDLGSCSLNLATQEYVIDSDSAYKLLINTNCTNSNLPAIDFNSYTLLGKYAVGKCKVEFKRQVLIYDLTKEYLYTVFVFEKGVCKKQAVSMNWVLIPKIKSGYSVNFSIVVV